MGDITISTDGRTDGRTHPNCRKTFKKTSLKWRIYGRIFTPSTIEITSLAKEEKP